MRKKYLALAIIGFIIYTGFKMVIKPVPVEHTKNITNSVIFTSYPMDKANQEIEIRTIINDLYDSTEIE